MPDAGPPPIPNVHAYPKARPATGGYSVADVDAPVVAAPSAPTVPLNPLYRLGGGDTSASTQTLAGWLDSAPRSETAVAVHLNFWQTPFAQQFLPFLTSVGLIGGLYIFGLLTHRIIQTVGFLTQEQTIVPSAVIIEGADVGIPNPGGLGGDAQRSSSAGDAEGVGTSNATDAWASKASKTLQQNLLGTVGAGEGGAADSLIGSGPDGGLGHLSGKGQPGGLGGTGDASADAPFGAVAGGGGQGPASPFMGVSGNARLVCYVCDASGSMMGSPWELLKRELVSAVDKLKPIQAYNIIFFKDQGAEAFNPSGLVMASPENKRKTYDFLDKYRLKADSDPIAGLRLAFEHKPQLIYLLTDGAFPDNKAVLDVIAKLNTDKKVKINTIAFFSPNLPESDKKVCIDVLKPIALKNGGIFRVVLTSDLMKGR